MTPPPNRPKIYHITHVDNLQAIAAGGGLSSDARVATRGGPPTTIGVSSIKHRRLGLRVPCHPGTMVGDYVPFYFCPRSIMLYVIHRANHRELTYREGQEQIVHLEADVHRVVQWAESEGVRWAFSLSNAGAYYAAFRNRLENLDQLNWEAITATDFRSQKIKEGKQAEFLVHGWLPWRLIDRIGVISTAIRVRADKTLPKAGDRPGLDVVPSWYY
jgi:ssDNA thymidine ADP-ribosyltransferase, DarT